MVSWRSHPQHHRGYLYLHRPAIVFAALVNEASFTYPLAQVTFDTVTTGAYTDIRPGMTVLFGSSAGADDLGRQRVRKAATSTILYIGESSIGTRDGEVYLGDGVHITVLDEYRVWAKIPRILSDGTTLKDFDLALGTFGTQMPPVANGGVGYAGFIDPDTELITVSFSGTGSFATADGATISTYLWEVDDGTITVGTSASSAITATFPAGFRWVHLTVTDSNGKTHTCHIPVFAAEVDDGLTIRDFVVEEDTLRREGHSMRFRILEDIAESDVPDGTLVMYFEDEVLASVHGSLAGPTGREHMKFVGFHQTDPASIGAQREGLYRDTTLACVDVAGRLATLPGFPQELTRKASPDDWQEMAGANIDLYLHYLLMWHSNALDLADFQWSGLGSTYPFKILGSDGQNLYDQVDQRAKAIGHRLTCDSRGRLWVLPDPMLLDSGSRTSTIQQDIDETDWTELSYEHQRPPRVHWLNGEAIKAGTTTSSIEALFCIAPGEAPGQGESDQTQGQQLVADQTELNAREGHRYARLNAPEGLFTISLAHGNDGGIEPALMQWVRMTISAATAAQRGLSFTDARFLVDEVEIQHRSERTGRVKAVQLRLEKETEGLPATTVIRPKGGANLPPFEFPPFTFPQIVWEPLAGEGSFWLNKGTGNMALINSDGYLYRTSDWTTPEAAGGPTWDRVATGITKILGFSVDPWSPLYIGTGSTVNGWVVATNGIYRLTDLLGVTPGVTLQYTYSGGNTIDWATNQRHATIEFGWGQQNFGVAALYYRSLAGHTGTWAAITTDGVNWSEVQISEFYDTNFSAGWYTSVFVSSRQPGLVYAGAYDVTGAYNGTLSGALYKSTDHGSSWSKVTNPNPQNILAQSVRCPWDDNVNQNILYMGGYSYSAGQPVGRVGGVLYRQNADLSISDITPVSGGKYYTPNRNWNFMVCPNDRLSCILSGYEDATFTHRVFVTRNGGNSWTEISTSSYELTFIAGDDNSVLYLLGYFGAVGYSTDFGTAVESKSGNIPASFPTAQTFVGIAGG